MCPGRYGFKEMHYRPWRQKQKIALIGLPLKLISCTFHNEDTDYYCFQTVKEWFGMINRILPIASTPRVTVLNFRIGLTSEMAKIAHEEIARSIAERYLAEEPC